MRMLTAAIAAIGSLVANAAQADRVDRYAYGDLSVVIERIGDPGAATTFCTIRAGDPNRAVLEVSMSDGDVHPPARYPWVSLTEYQPYPGATPIGATKVVKFVFDTNDNYEGRVSKRKNDDGNFRDVAEIDELDTLSVLRSMRRADQVDFHVGRDIVHLAALRGFDDAYAKMAESCGFTTAGVIEDAAPVLVYAAAPAPEELPEPKTDYYDYRDWTTIVETLETTEDTRITCTAKTGGDGSPTLYVTLSNGDGGPPYYYPPLSLREGAARGYRTQMQDGDPVNFVFDDGAAFPGAVSGGFDEEGFAYAIAEIAPAFSLPALQGMRRAKSLLVVSGGKVVSQLSLNGFTAAYGKMAEACSFSTVGVIG